MALTTDYSEKLKVLKELIGHIIRLLDEEDAIISELLHNMDLFPYLDGIQKDYYSRLEQIKQFRNLVIGYLQYLEQKSDEYECASSGEFSSSVSEIIESGERLEEKNGFLSALDSLEMIDDDVKAIIEAARAQGKNIAHSIAETSMDSPLSKQERAALRRKQLAKALRKGDPIVVLPNGVIERSTTDSIAALHEQLAGGGEITVNSDGTILNSSDSEQVNVGFKPVDKAIVAVRDNEGGIRVPNAKLAGDHGMCRICGTVFNQETNYCPCCGTKTVIDKTLVQLDKVFFSAVAPKSIVKGEYAIIDIYMYEEDFRSVVEEAIANAENEVRETKSGIMRAGKKSNIKVVLTSPDLTIDDNTEEQVWLGEYLDFSFAVELPDDFQKKQILFMAAVYINDVIATRLKFIAKCMVSAEQKLEVNREDVLSAFVSYASQDRKRVAMIIQGMKKARPDMDVFFDVESLRSGDDWESALWHEIDKRDVLFLCWSKSARDSQWVDAEWRYALKQKGSECIEPVPIDPPEVCPPPIELNKKHFNDKLLYIINNSEYDWNRGSFFRNG